MNVYQVPHISTIYPEPFRSELQYTPDCDGDSCTDSQGLNLGSECLDNNPDIVQVRVLVPGSGNTTPPDCDIFVDGNLITSGCTVDPSSECPDTWLFFCTDQGVVAPDFTCPGNVAIQCEGSSLVPCDNDIS